PIPLLLSIILLPTLAIPATTPPAKTRFFVSHYENVLGTSLELKVAVPDQQTSDKAEHAVLAEIDRLSKILSGYDATSEFSRWQRTTGTPVQISRELFEVLSLFDQWRERTGGALDASAETITRVWKQAAKDQRLPATAELEAAVEKVKQLHWRLDPATRSATHLDNAPLMLNSFAKSYIIQHAADAGRAASGAAAIIVNIGGDLVVSGNTRETILVSDPTAAAENDNPIDRLLVGNAAIATSGNYRRGENIGGHWYSHIVDPRTGQPADQILSATVVAPGATDAGALATSFNVMSPAESIQLAKTIPGVEYLIITRSGERIQSPGWRALELPAAAPRPAIKTSPDATQATTPASASITKDFELIVNLEINLQKEGSVKRPYVAVWVEDENHASVRTITLWHGAERYLPELRSWFLKYRGLYNTDKNFSSSVTSATRSAGKYAVKWDGKDDKGNDVPPGKYIVKIEISREHGTYQLMRQEIDCDDTPKSFTLPGNIEISAASLDYRKKTNGN
ncbi:MAG TPA: DUF2271 domain-containing protein, partial [Puia sp.]|nr:DUF2271 domain-containing protein [Puia sp.]